ncbi:MAG TPA: carbon-nitrogen hydrolase family protein [Verrucomicrobiae bacterium]
MRTPISFASVALAALLLTPAGARAAHTYFDFSSPDNAGWTTWSPRKDIEPNFSVSKNGGRAKDSALQVKSDSVSDFGAWKKKFNQIEPGKPYRFTGWFKTSNVKHEYRTVAPRLEWQDAKGNAVRPPEYAIATKESDGWKHFEIISTPPEKAISAELQLGVGFAENATVLWDDLSFAPADSARDRLVRVATVFHRPRNTKSAAESVEDFCRVTKEAVLKNPTSRPDIICLPEGISVVGTSKFYFDVGESLPGPTSTRLGSLAKELNSYIVAGIYEKEGSVLYNTALLLGRDGKLIGKYRKTHLPREEWEAGITPGDEYPVFDTDFGKVGLIICWDVQFPEPSRAMARKGAELLLLPIWGGNETLAKARAIENHVFLVSSSYDMKTFVVDPEGKVLAEATKENPVAFADLHLDQKIYQYWLGDMKARTWRERRPDLPID